MAALRGFEPTVVRAFSRSGDDLGLARLPWPNVEVDDVLELDGGDFARVVDVVHVPAGSAVAAFVKVAGRDMIRLRDTLAR